MRLLLVTGFFLSLLLAAPLRSADIPEDTNLQVNMGVNYFKLGQYEAAATAYRRVLELAPEHPQAQQRLETVLSPTADPPPAPTARRAERAVQP